MRLARDVCSARLMGAVRARIAPIVPSLQAVCGLGSRVFLVMQKTLLNNGNSTKSAYRL